MRGEEGPLPSRWPPLSLGGRCRAERRLNSRRRGVGAPRAAITRAAIAGGHTAGGYYRRLWLQPLAGCVGAWEVPQGMLSG